MAQAPSDWTLPRIVLLFYVTERRGQTVAKPGD